MGSFDAYGHQASNQQSMAPVASYPGSNGGMNPYGLQQRTTGYDYGQSSNQQAVVNQLNSNPGSSSSNCSANNNFWLSKLQQNSLSGAGGAGGMPFQVNQNYVPHTPSSQNQHHSTPATYLNSSQYGGIYAATNQSANAAIDGLHQYNNLIRTLHPKSTAATSSSTSTSPNSSSSSFSSASSTSSSSANLSEHNNMAAPGIHFMANPNHNAAFGGSMIPMMPLTPDESTNSLNSDLNTSPTTSTSSSASSCSNAYLSKAYHQHQQHLLGHSTTTLLSASSNDNKLAKLTGLNQRKQTLSPKCLFMLSRGSACFQTPDTVVC